MGGARTLRSEIMSYQHLFYLSCVNKYWRGECFVLQLFTQRSGELLNKPFTGWYATMQLRNHPMMFHRGRRNWPPAWVWTGTGLDEQPRDEHPSGEVGRLHDIQIFKADSRLVLVMAYQNAPYIGCLRFDDAATSQRIGAILRRQLGRSIKQIGDLDLSALLSTATTPGVAATPSRRNAVGREAPFSRRFRSERMTKNR
jgi:hypothetical protein